MINNHPEGQKELLTPQRGWLYRLFSCVYWLGPRLGWKYWRIENSSWKHPERVLEWATRCRRKAITAPEPYRSAYLSWAENLEDNFEEWQSTKAPSVIGSPESAAASSKPTSR